jgi:hypothetical protein
MEEELVERLEDAISERPDLAGALQIAADAIEGVTEASVDDAGWEAAVLDRTLDRRKFRRLSMEEIGAARAGG